MLKKLFGKTRTQRVSCRDDFRGMFGLVALPVTGRVLPKVGITCTTAHPKHKS